MPKSQLIAHRDDDVVVELCYNLIEGSRYVRYAASCSSDCAWYLRANLGLQPDIKSLQIQLTGFLDKDTAPFCKELWNLCLSAQTSPQGIPRELLEAKKMELIQEKVLCWVWHRQWSYKYYLEPRWKSRETRWSNWTERRSARRANCTVRGMDISKPIIRTDQSKYSWLSQPTEFMKSRKGTERNLRMSTSQMIVWSISTLILQQT